MHPRTAAAFLACLLTACGEPPPSWPDDDFGPVHAPRAAIELGNTLLAGRQGDVALPVARRRFLAAFQRGFRNPEPPAKAGAVTADEVEAVAFRGGQDYRRQQAGQLDAAMRGFGYEPCVMDGVYEVGFEISCLRPAGAGGPGYWVEFLADIRLPWTDADRERVLVRSKQVRATGYLSAPGVFGHLGAYPREFLAMAMVPLPE